MENHFNNNGLFIKALESKKYLVIDVYEDIDISIEITNITEKQLFDLDRGDISEMLDYLEEHDLNLLDYINYLKTI